MIGAMRTRIVIEQPATTQNAYGEIVNAWSTFATRWAKKTIKGGKEGELAGAIRQQASAEYTLRKLVGVTTQMRITDGGTVYNILDAESDQYGKTTRLLAREVT